MKTRGAATLLGLLALAFAQGVDAQKVTDREDNMSWLLEKQTRVVVERSSALIHVMAAPPKTFSPATTGRLVQSRRM